MPIITSETIGPEPYRPPEGYAAAYAVRFTCETCGAGVVDHEKHTAWHETNDKT